MGSHYMGYPGHPRSVEASGHPHYLRAGSRSLTHKKEAEMAFSDPTLEITLHHFQTSYKLKRKGNILKLLMDERQDSRTSEMRDTFVVIFRKCSL